MLLKQHDMQYNIMSCTFLSWPLGFVPIDISEKKKKKTSVSTLSENHFACVSGKHVVLTLDTHRCCLSHRYRPGRLHLFTLLTIVPLLNSSCRVIPALSWVSGGSLRDRKAGAPWSSRWQCFSAAARRPSQHRTQHLFSYCYG